MELYDFFFRLQTRPVGLNMNRRKREVNEWGIPLTGIMEFALHISD